jgi:long-chain fatty acid transport protein
MKHAVKSLLCGALLAVVGLPSVSFATNGMVLIGYGTKSRGAGGVAIAMPQDAISGAVNPANISFIGSRVDAGADIFLPRAESRLGDIRVKSRADLFLMPAMGGTYRFNRKVTMGFSATPFGGGGTRYNTNLYNASSTDNPTPDDLNQTLGVQLMVMQMNPTIAYKVNKQNSVGASLVFSIQTFRAFGLDYFSNFPQTGLFTARLSNTGNDWSYGAGARIGWMGNYLDKKLSIGAAYQSRVYMTEFDKYSDLFAEQGDIDTPANVGVGVSYKFTPKLTIGVDVTRMFYSDVASIGNDSAQTSGSPFPISQDVNGLGLPDGLGFGWEDQDVYKIGAIYDYSNEWTFRAGWNYGDSPIDESNGEILFSMLAPAITRHHLTLGTTYSPSKKMELSFSYVHAFKYEQEGPTLIGGTGKLSMYQNSFGMSFGYKI